MGKILSESKTFKSLIAFNAKYLNILNYPVEIHLNLLRFGWITTADTNTHRYNENNGGCLHKLIGIRKEPNHTNCVCSLCTVQVRQERTSAGRSGAFTAVADFGISVFSGALC